MIQYECDTEETEIEPVTESSVLAYKQAVNYLDLLHSYAVHHSNRQLIDLMMQAETILYSL
jgi:hypothetical protein